MENDREVAEAKDKKRKKKDKGNQGLEGEEILGRRKKIRNR